MKIIDTTTYFDEKLMMSIRFNILNSFVDKFIVCESRYSHSGKEKEINFDIKDYPEFQNKIIHLVLDNEPKDLIISKNLTSGEKRLNSIVNYEIIIKSIIKITKNKHYELLETLAEDIFFELFKNININKIKLKIEKTQIIKNTSSVGIEITKKNYDK